MTDCSTTNEPAVEPKQINLLIGITIAVSTSFIQSLGLTIQRKSHVLNENIYPKELRRSACRRPLWHLGFDTYLISNIIGSIFSIGYLPIIILAPLGAVTLIFNAFFAQLLLGDVFSRQSVIGTLFILIGAVMIAFFGVVKAQNHSLNDLIELYKRPAFIAYFSTIEFILIVVLIAAKYGEYLLNRSNRNDREFILGWHWKKFQTVLGITYGMVGGMISSQSLLFAKSGIELLLLTINCRNQFDRPLSWIIVIALIVTALLQLYYLNKGLRMCDTVILVPLSFCTYNASSIFNGLVYYDQWDELEWYQILLVILGICILLCGVLVLSWRRNVAPEEGLLTGEESRMLYGQDIEGLTELYEGEETFTRYRDLDGFSETNSPNVCQNIGNSSREILKFQEMIQEEDNHNADEKTSLLGKKHKSRRNKRSVSVGTLQEDNYGII
ncbi:4162_t:CDS:2 [Dentiscutata erythropus]|uniref:4162_t:CDS:1 n=1 Tax=Dentiscutata erythropus TaxID=1348616 RepID=A0A9N9HLA4_9GLOM|nr:4162_t:CDS:2 [Dentiscutata erythropus]